MFDVVVIGAGPGGYVAAIRAAQNGGKVAVVENRDLGGTCLNRGCIPTKALVKSAETYVGAKEAHAYGTKVGDVELDFPAVMKHKDKTINKLATGVGQLLKGNGVEIYKGTADIPKPGLVEVTYDDGSTDQLETKDIIIATGAKPQLPPVSKQALDLTISSDDALELDAPPERMLIIGGGVLGIEFACIYAAFGTQVEAIKRTPLIVPPIDDELSVRMVPLLKRRGIKITTGVYLKDITEENGCKVLHAESLDEKPMRFETDVVLVAMGRIPNFGGIDLEALQVEHSKWGIEVNEYMETSVPGIYAIGDAVGKFFLASVASAEGIIAADAICGEKRSMNYDVVPSCVFTLPEAASVGLKEKEAREQGIDIVVSKFPYGANGKALSMGETSGMVKIVARADDHKLLGVHILGAHATDLIHEPAIALKMGATAEDIADLPHAHPTLAETIMEAAHGITHKPIHIPPSRRRS